MDLTLTEDQTALLRGVSEFLTDQLPISVLREGLARPSSIDRAFWAQLAELGWFGFSVPEADGGGGWGVVDETLLLREAGRRLVPGPLISTSLAAHVAVQAGARELAAAIIAGSAPVGLAVEHAGDWTLIDAEGCGWVLECTPERAALVPLATFGPLEHQPPLDDTSRIASVGQAGQASYEVEGPATWQRGVLLSAAMLAGVSAGVRDMAVLQARTREQFGSPIGVNQAIKHRCADMAVRTEAAESLVTFAALCVDEGRDDADFQVLAARLIAHDAAVTGARANIQIHGGMGFSFESDAHLYLKRAHLLDHMFGRTSTHATALMATEASTV